MRCRGKCVLEVVTVEIDGIEVLNVVQFHDLLPQILIPSDHLTISTSTNLQIILLQHYPPSI